MNEIKVLVDNAERICKEAGLSAFYVFDNQVKYCWGGYRNEN